MVPGRGERHTVVLPVSHRLRKLQHPQPVRSGLRRNLGSPDWARRHAGRHGHRAHARRITQPRHGRVGCKCLSRWAPASRPGGRLLLWRGRGPSGATRSPGEDGRNHTGPQCLSTRKVGVHSLDGSAVPAGRGQVGSRWFDVHRRYVSRDHPGKPVDSQGLVPARKGRAVSAGQDRRTRPHLAADE